MVMRCCFPPAKVVNNMLICWTGDLAFLTLSVMLQEPSVHTHAGKGLFRASEAWDPSQGFCCWQCTSLTLQANTYPQRPMLWAYRALSCGPESRWECSQGASCAVGSKRIIIVQNHKISCYFQNNCQLFNCFFFCSNNSMCYVLWFHIPLTL